MIEFRAKYCIPAALLTIAASPVCAADEQTPLLSGPAITAFDGLTQLTRAASRQGLLTQKLGFTMLVNAQGEATECKLHRKFRRKATEIAICRPLLKYMKFEPARDLDGNAVTASYTSVIDFNMWMTERGYLAEEVRN